MDSYVNSLVYFLFLKMMLNMKQMIAKNDSNCSKQKEYNSQCNRYGHYLFIWYSIIWSSFIYGIYTKRE